MSNPNQQPDAYEREFMSADGEVLFRDRAMAPLVFPGALLAGAVGFVVMGFVVPDAWPAALVGAPILSMTGLTMMALRTSVTTEVVHVQYGLFGPKIPVADIVSCTPVHYSFWKVGGWGVRRSLDGAWVYNMMGDGQRAAEILYRDGSRTKKVLISVKDLDGFVAAVHGAVDGARARQPASALQESRAALGVGEAPVVDPISVPVEEIIGADASRRR